MARIAGDHIGVALPATLLLLAGGESRRMGRPKALLPVERVTLLEWLAERLAPGFERLLVAARDPDQLPDSLRDRFVADRHPGAGPLAGVEAGLETALVSRLDLAGLNRRLAHRRTPANSRGSAGAEGVSSTFGPIFCNLT